MSGRRAFKFDFEDRLSEAGDGEVRFAYDGDGNRVAKTAGGVTTRYLVDTNSLTGYAQAVEELDGGSVRRVYAYGLDLVSQYHVLGGEWRASFYSYDGHGSVRFLTDESGADTDTDDAFGVLIWRIGSTPNEYLYAGGRLDPQTGLDYLRARYLNPQSGRFMSVDPFAGRAHDPGSLHRYTYAHNDPVNNIDPSRMMTLSEQNLTIGIMGLIAATILSFHTITQGLAQGRGDP